MNHEPISVCILAKTAKAVKVTDGLTELWIPLSLIDEEAGELELNEYQEINVEDWFLEKEGLL